MTLIAKQTKYRGYKFASRLEGKWAYFLDLNQVPWEYEREGYDLDGLTYYPDFWLPSLKVWLEIKGELITDEIGAKVVEKCKRLATLSIHPVVLTFHDPLDQRCVTFGVKGGMYAESHFTLCSHCGAFGLHVRTGAGPRFHCPQIAEHGEPLPITTTRQLRRTFYDMATAARQRRFGAR